MEELDLKKIFKEYIFNKNFLENLDCVDSNSVVYNLDLLDKISEYYELEAHNIGFDLLYSVKANMNLPVLKTLMHHVDGFDCASIYEYEFAKKAKPRQFFFDRFRIYNTSVEKYKLEKYSF